MSQTKIYTNDPLVAYASTEVSPERTMEEISAILRYYGTTDIHWHYPSSQKLEQLAQGKYDQETLNIYVTFSIEEVIEGKKVKVAAHVQCPILWKKASSYKSVAKKLQEDRPDLRVSMRTMFHYIKTHLEAAYAMQSSRVASFMSDIITPSGKTLYTSLANSGRLSEFAALEAPKTQETMPQADWLEGPKKERIVINP